MTGIGDELRRNLAQLALQALDTERDLALAAAEGETITGGVLPNVDPIRDAALRDLGLVVYPRPARPLQPPGAKRPTRAQAGEIHRAAWAQASGRGRTNRQATFDRLVAGQGQPGGLRVMDAAEWLAAIDRDERQVVRVMAPADRPRFLPDSDSLDASHRTAGE